MSTAKPLLFLDRRPIGLRSLSRPAGLQPKQGLSLLEVLLSIAILGASMVVIGNMFFLGVRSAMRARLRSDANLLCDSKMAELAAGLLPLSAVNGQPIAENQDWTYSIDVQPSIQRGLLVATVSVEQADTSVPVPVSLSIVRLIPDPDYEPDEEEEE
jgi:Tfp pilus assembly protein PilV